MKRPIWSKLLGFGILMSLIMGCASAPVSTPASTSIPAATNTPVPTSAPEITASPAPITITMPDPPVPTLDGQAEQARAFAEPILQAIADRPLDVEDDFSFDNGNWDLGYGENPAQITGGALRLSATEATRDEWSGAYHGAMSADDFVFRFDVRVTAMEFDSHLSILWRWLPSDNEAYRITLFPSLNGAWAVDNAEVQVATGNSDAVALNEWFTVTIIGRGDRFAVLLDDQSVCYFEDSKRPIGRAVLGMNIFTGNATAEFDNVKYWNLANVPGLP